MHMNEIGFFMTVNSHMFLESKHIFVHCCILLILLKHHFDDMGKKDSLFMVIL